MYFVYPFIHQWPLGKILDCASVFFSVKWEWHQYTCLIALWELNESVYECLEGTWHMLLWALGFLRVYSIRVATLTYVSYKPKKDRVSVGEEHRAVFSFLCLDDGVIESDSMLIADTYQFSSSFIPHLGKLLRKPTHSIFWWLQKVQSTWALFQIGTLSPAHPTTLIKAEASLPSSSLSGHFQTCLRACPALPRKPHYVRNKAFYTFLMHVQYHQSGHLSEFWGGVHPTSAG